MKNRYITFLVVMVALTTSWLLLSLADEEASEDTQNQTTNRIGDAEPSSRLASTFPDVDFSQALVSFDDVLSGGVEKDGIPAISEPKFDPLSAAIGPPETLGILVEIDGVKRFYPYNILVSHEIVNDTINDTDFAVTFCPLCGSALVFDRAIDDGQTVEFGVSGFLFESNLIMYDRTDTPSLWSQARTEAIIGDQSGTQLELIDFQLLSQADVIANHPDALILSTNTGYSRTYTFDPYSGYDEREETIFPVSVNDTRFPAKEVFYIVPLDQLGVSLAIRAGELERGQSATHPEFGLTVTKTAGGELDVQTSGGETQKGYYEMWFSWAQHHQEDGEVWDLSAN